MSERGVDRGKPSLNKACSKIAIWLLLPARVSHCRATDARVKVWRGRMDNVEMTAEDWLLRAAEARTKAERMRTSYGRSILLADAAKYERLAQEANVPPARTT
jgi:hypothetical protein